MPCSCYLCCIGLIILFILLIAYWYIALPIIIILITSYTIITHQKNLKYLYTLDSPKNQENFTRETSLQPLKDGKLTKEYEKWLLQNDRKKKTALQIPSMQRHQSTMQQPPSPQLQLQEHAEIPEASISSKEFQRETETLSISPKEFKVKFKDYTRNEKIIRIISNLIATIILIIFIISAIISFIHQNYLSGIIFLTTMIILIIPNEIIEHVLSNRARKRKAIRYAGLRAQKTFPIQSPEKLDFQPSFEPTNQLLLKQSPIAEKITCPYCGAEIMKEDKFCKECGSKLE